MGEVTEDEWSMLHTREHQDIATARVKNIKADQLLKVFITNPFLEPQNIKGSFSLPSDPLIQL